MRRFEEATADYGPCNRIVARATIGRSQTFVSLSACSPNEGTRLRRFDDLVVGIFDTGRPFFMDRDRGHGFERLRIRPGSVYAIPWGCDRYVAWTGTYRFPSIAIPRAWVTQFLADILPDGEGAVIAAAHLAAEDPVIAVLVRRLVERYAGGGPAGDLDDLYGDQSAGLIVSALLNAAGRRDDGGPEAHHWRIRRAMDFARAERSRKVALEAMAGAAGLSRFHFARQFKAATGRSPHQWLTDERLAEARNLLMTTRRSVGDIASETGFGSASRFGEVFRQRFGVTPTVFRDRMA